MMPRSMFELLMEDEEYDPGETPYEKGLRIGPSLVHQVARAREALGTEVCFRAFNYNNIGVLLASSRQCDDGVVVNRATWIPDAMFMDMPNIQDCMYGCPSMDPPRFKPGRFKFYVQ